MRQMRKLFEPIKIGNLELKNRLIFLAMGTHFSNDDRIHDRLTDFYAERARGGVGFIIAPFMVSYQGYHAPGESRYYSYNQPGIYDDEFIPELSRFVDAMHRNGAKVAAQLQILDKWAAGKTSPLEWVGPSNVAKPQSPVPRELTVAEIEQIVEQFGDAARRAREAGFDAVEIYAGMGFLLNQFLSRYTNKRTDHYGGTPEDRSQIVVEIVASIRQKAGQDYPVSCRISGDDLINGGNTLDDTRKIAVVLQDSGIHLLDVQAGWLQSPVPIINMSVPRGAFVYIAEEIKKVVNIPVAAAYRINDPVLANQILEDGRADLIGICRALIADPYFPIKAMEGRVYDICPCIACTHCIDLTHAVPEGLPLACSVNPMVGKETEYIIKPAQEPKKVFVIGGGPAGMEAARVAALRGHSVTLADKGQSLGGQLLTAAVPPHKDELSYFVKYLSRQVEKSGVKVRLNTEVKPDDVISANPDVVILATGAVPLIPNIPGIENANVVTAVDVLRNSATAGHKCIILGGGLVGCETALFLAARKAHEVIILEMLDKIGADIGKSNRWLILKQLKEAGVAMRTKSKVVAITANGVEIDRGGYLQFLEVDSVILAAGMKSNNKLAEKLRGNIGHIYTVGDCASPRRLGSAIEEGFNIARQI